MFQCHRDVKGSNFWLLADYVKRRLFNRLRDSFYQIDYLSYHKYREAVERIYEDVLNEWNEIKSELSQLSDRTIKRLKGFLFEALFYYSCLKIESLFKDAEILEMAGVKFEKHPPWFEATPLYDIVPMLHHLKEDDKLIRKSPQTLADFLITYVDDTGPYPPSLIDVKSRKPRGWDERWEWCYIAAMRRGFIFQIVYPKEGIRYPRDLAEWEVATPCMNCKNLSLNYRVCQSCGQTIYPRTIVDAIHRTHEIIDKAFHKK